jgi:hypothetical protein
MHFPIQEHQLSQSQQTRGAQNMDKTIETAESQADYQASGIKELGELELAYVGGGIAELVGV